MTEPDVVITDYLLTLEAALFSALLWRSASADSDLRVPFVAFFAATALAALMGGTVHGFFVGDSSPAGAALWRATLVALGLSALAAWAIGATMLLTPGSARTLQMAATAVFVAYALIIIFVNDSFWVAIANYLPPTLLMLVALAIRYQRHGGWSTLAGLVGLVLTLVASVVQQRQMSLHPVYFNHNALYHAIQAVALFLIYWAARVVVSR